MFYLTKEKNRGPIYMHRLLIKQLVIISLLGQIITQPILYQKIPYNNSTHTQTNSIALDNIFTDNLDPMNIVNSEPVNIIVELYHQKKIDNKDIELILLNLKNQAEKTNKKEMYMQILAGVIFKLYYQYLGEIEKLDIKKAHGKEIPIVIQNKNNYKFVFKCIANDINEAKYITSSYLRLLKKEVPVPEILPRNGLVSDNVDSYITETMNKCYIVMKCLDENIIYGYNQNLLQYREKGRIIAKINNAFCSFVPEGKLQKKDKHKFLELLKSYDDLIKQIRNKNPEYNKLVTIDGWAKIKYESFLNKQWNLFSKNCEKIKGDLKYSQIHGDLHNENMFFNKDKITGIIDLDDTHVDYRTFEIMKGVIGVEQKCCYSKDRLKEVIMGFQESANDKLSDNEIRGIIEILRYRFLHAPQQNWRDIESYFKGFKQFAEDFSTEEKINAFIEDIKLQSQTPEEFLKEVQKKYGEDYQKDSKQTNLKCWNKAREAHINQVIKIYYAFIAENFEYIYNAMSEKTKAKTNKNKYISKLHEIKKLYYDSLNEDDKTSLEIGTIFHDRGYAISDDVMDHTTDGAKFIIQYLKDNQTKFGTVNIDDITLIIRHHGDYGTLGVTLLFDEWQKIMTNAKYNKYIFLIYLFDNMGKMDRDNDTKPDNLFDLSFFDMCEEQEKINNEKSFVKLRFRNFLSLPIAISEIDEIYKDLFEKKLEEFNIDKKFWANNIHMNAFCLISDLFKLPYISDEERKKMCERLAKFICIIERVAKTQNNERITIDDNMNFLLMHDGLLIKRRIYYERFIIMLDELSIEDIKTMPMSKNDNEIMLGKFRFEIQGNKLRFDMKGLPNIYSFAIAMANTLKGLINDAEFIKKNKILYDNLIILKKTLPTCFSEIINLYLQIIKSNFNNEITQTDIITLHTINCAL
jgi:hypothetical protein